MKRYSKNGIIALCSLIYFASYFARKDFAAVSAAILQSGFTDKETVGLIGTALFAMYGIGQVISGILGDKISPKILLGTGLLTSLLCNLAMPFIPSAKIMIPVWGINGLAQAMLWPPIVRILSEHLDHERYVKANLIVTTAAHVATVLLYLYTPVCLVLFNWKAVFISAGSLCAITFVFFLIGLKTVLPKESSIAPVNGNSSSESSSENSKKELSIAPANENFFKLLLKSGIFYIFGAIIAMGYLRDGIESWLPTLYSEAFNRDASESILISVILPIFSIFSIVIITALHKKVFQNEVVGASVMFLISIITCVPLYFLMNSSSAIGRIICLVLSALICGTMHCCNFLYISCLPGRFAKHGHAAGTSGICNACTYVGAAISTYGIAAISQHFDWSANIVTWGIIALVGLGFCLLAYRRYTANAVNS